MKRTLLLTAILAVSSTAHAQPVPPKPVKDKGAAEVKVHHVGEGGYTLTITTPKQDAEGPAHIAGQITRNGANVTFTAADLVFTGTDADGTLVLNATWGKGSLSVNGKVAANGGAAGTVEAKGAGAKALGGGTFTLERTMVAKKKQSEPQEPGWKKLLCKLLPICL